MKFKENLRIIWAITAKDMTDAIKNKIVQGVLIGVAFMMLSSQALSLLVSLKDEPTAHYWDQGRSVVIKEIVRSRELNFYPRDDLSDLQKEVTQSPEPIIGIVIPANFDEQVSTETQIELQAYVAHWPKPEVIADLITHFETQLSARTGIRIEINLDGNQIFPLPQSIGYPMMVAFGLVLGVMTVGLILTPYLIVDEKETRTLDALLLSPARAIHLFIGKSLVGLFYSLSASLLILIFSWRWIVHWEIVILAIFLGGLSAVSVGLLVGTSFDTPTNVNMFVGMLLAIFLLPMYLWTSLAPKLSPFFQSLISAMPSIAMYKLVRLSFTGSPILSMLGINVIILSAWTVVMLLFVAWRIQKMER